MNETWQDIPDLDNYQASTKGRIRSFKFKGDPRIIKPYYKRDRYAGVLLSINGKPKFFLVHRLVAKTFIPNPLGLSDIDHKDQDIKNNNIENLSWLSHHDNILKDQGKTIICTYKDGKELIIRGGRQAAAATGCTRRTVLRAIKEGWQAKNGWSFKYKK